MLIMTRKPMDAIIINSEITIKILSVGPKFVKVGIIAPNTTSVHRHEIQERIDKKIPFVPKN